MQDVMTVSRPGWPRDTTPTRDLSSDFSRTVFEAVLGQTVGDACNRLMMSALIPVGLEVFNWEAAERRADWEESHGRFVEFSNIKDLLSYLHS